MGPANPAGISGAGSHSADSPLAWLVVFAAFLSMFTVSAVAYSFGAFVNPMIAEFHAGRAAVSAVFSVTVFLYFLVGSVTGLLSDGSGLV